MKKKLVGFDLDGVLIDSLPLMKIAWEECMNKFSLNKDFLEYKKHIGKPFEEIMNSLDLDCFLPELKQKYDQLCINNLDLIKPYEGVQSLLNNLSKSDEIYISIITSKTKIRAKKIVEEFNFNHQLLVTPEDVPRGKPNPDPLFIANRFFDIRPSQTSCLYIGDMDTDFIASRSANWFFIYAAWGYGEINFENKKFKFERCDNINFLDDFLEKWKKI